VLTTASFDAAAVDAWQNFRVGEAISSRSARQAR
jgi:hypothetical protein